MELSLSNQLVVQNWRFKEAAKLFDADEFENAKKRLAVPGQIIPAFSDLSISVQS
jgi:hypothetical protein